MLYASTHFAGVAGPGNTPPVVSAAPCSPPTGTTDQDRIINAVKRVEPSVVALQVVVNGTQLVPTDPMAQFFGGGGPVPAPARRRARVGLGLRLLPRRPDRHERARRARRARARSPSSSRTATASRARLLVEPRRRSGAREGRRIRQAAAAGRVRRQLAAPGRPVGDRDRRAALAAEVGLGRRRVGLQPRRADPATTTSSVAPVQGPAPDVGADQPRQLRRPARRLRRPRHRREPVDGEPRGRARHRLRDPVEHGHADRRRARQDARARRSTRTGPAPASGYLGVLLGPTSTTTSARSSAATTTRAASWSAKCRLTAPADQAGIEPGDVIQPINGKPVNQPSDVTTHQGDEARPARHAARLGARRQEERPGEARRAAGRPTYLQQPAAAATVRLPPAQTKTKGAPRGRPSSRSEAAARRNHRDRKVVTANGLEHQPPERRMIGGGAAEGGVQAHNPLSGGKRQGQSGFATSESRRLVHAARKARHIFHG